MRGGIAVPGDLDAAADGKARCGDDQGNLRRATRSGEDRGKAASAGHGAAAGNGAAATADPGCRERAVAQRRARDDGQHCRDHRALAPDIVTELRAPGAVLDVPPERSPPQGAAAERRDLLADLLARRVAGLAALEQGGAGLEDERLHLRDLAIDDLGDVDVR